MLTTDNLLTQAVKKLSTCADHALNCNSAEEFENFERQLNEFEATVREVEQQLWLDQAQTAIRHLQNGDELTPGDMELIRVFLISDAEYYLKYENNFNCWVGELKRLIEDIAGRSEDVDRESIQDLRGVLKDAVRLVPDIRNYLEEKARVERFNSGMRRMDSATRQTLLKLLKEQMTSSNR